MVYKFGHHHHQQRDEQYVDSLVHERTNQAKLPPANKALLVEINYSPLVVE